MDALSCEACGAPLTKDGIDRVLRVVACSRCDSLFQLAAPELRQLDGGEAAKRRARAPLALPRGTTVRRLGRRLRLRWRWFRPAALGLAFFAAFWDGFLVVWYVTVLSGEGKPPLMAILFPLVHVAVGVGVTYGALLGLVERTTIDVDPGALSVSHGPLPWGPSPTVLVHELKQLYVAKKVRHGKNGPRVTYEVRAVTERDKALLLVRGLPEVEQALWLEQEIETHLGLTDERVDGEFGS